MSEFVKILFPSLLSKKKVKLGFGPFIPSTLKSFLNGKCSICNDQINESSIFGNSLIIKENSVRLICCKCRIGYGNGLPINYRINRDRVLIEIFDLKVKYRITWYEFLIGLRLGYSYFQNGFMQFEKAFKRNIDRENYYFSDDAPIKDKYGFIDELNNCGECGGFWQNQFDKETIKKVVELGCCYHCGFPNNHQWNMRTTFKDEIQINSL